MTQLQGKILHFTPAEFVRKDKHGNPVSWWDHMDPRLLVSLDMFRTHWDLYQRHRHSRPGWVDISSSDGAICRQQGAKSKSDHNIDRWGEGRGIDVIPSRMITQADARTAFDLAVECCCINAIGLYPMWNQGPGLHLGLRYDRAFGDPADVATWGARYVISPDGHSVQEYFGFEEAIDLMPEELLA